MNMKKCFIRDVLMTIAQICVITALFLETNMKVPAILTYVGCLLITISVNLLSISKNKNMDKTSINNTNKE